MKKRVFSGIQPTGNIHIGNYIGAIQNWVHSQDEYDNIFCIVDLHAITVYQDPKELKHNCLELARLLIACGIDPSKSKLFVQSDIAHHAELTWMLNCIIPIGWMMRMTQFKDKSPKQRENANVGLFDYPALMAADILLYKTDLVPVGEDQKQHLELARNIAQRFNNIYSDTFKIPEPLVPKIGARVMGLDNPEKKMSKSEKKSGHAVNLLDEPDLIRKKIMRATTDSGKDIVFDPARPAIFNLLTLYEVFSQMKRKDIEARFAGKGYGDFKKDLAEVIIETLKPIQEKYRRIKPDEVTGILTDSASCLRPEADKVLTLVKKRMGLGASNR